MINLTVTSDGTFAERIKTRSALWSNAKFSARIQVPPELVWWYWHEFGTNKGAWYDIKPVNSKFLVFEDSSGLRFEEGVQNPGFKASRMVARVEDIIIEAAIKYVQSAFAEGAFDDPALLQAAVLAATTNAKEIIVASIAETLTGTKAAPPGFPNQGGRLGGQTAASVFDSQATVIENNN